MNIHLCLSQIIFCSRTSAVCSLRLCAAQKHKNTKWHLFCWPPRRPLSEWVYYRSKKKTPSNNLLFVCWSGWQTHHNSSLGPHLSLCSAKQTPESNQTAHLDAALASNLRSFATSSLLGAPEEISDCLGASHPVCGRMVSLPWGDRGLGQSFFIRLHRSSYPVETENRGRGGTSCTSSSESRERDGAEGAETRFRGVEVCVCVWGRCASVSTNLWSGRTPPGWAGCKVLAEDLRKWAERRRGAKPGRGEKRNRLSTEDGGREEKELMRRSLLTSVHKRRAQALFKPSDSIQILKRHYVGLENEFKLRLKYLLFP